MNRLYNKVVIVTGGNGLLGKEIISSLKAEGALCINIDINHDTDIELGLYKCDITNSDSIDFTLSLICSKYGKIDGLVNNAYPRTKDWGNIFDDISMESWRNNVDWQLNSYFYITQKVASLMKTNKNGSIINIGSIYGVVGPDFSVYEGTGMTMPAAYSAIKGALVNFTRYLCSYLGPSQIRVNLVSPGGIFDNQNQTFVDNYSKKVPLKRMGVTKDISPAIIFLLSDESSYITGQNLVIDGGWTAI